MELSNNEVILGNVDDQIVVFDASDLQANISLSAIAAILTPILIGAGLKALMEFITTGEFGFKYPGGKLKFHYNFNKEQDPAPNTTRHKFSLIMDNEINLALN